MKRGKVPVREPEVPLAANRLFEGLPLRERDRALGSCIRKRFVKGERIFSAGDRPEFIYLLEAGHVKLVSVDEKGWERILNIFRPGDIFGEILFSVERRPFDTIAMDAARVAILPRATFLAFLQGSNQWGLNFIRMVSDRLFVMERDLAALSRTWTRPRLIHLLLKLADNLGEPGADGVLIQVPVTHETLANMIGASRVRVTSTLNRLRREGLLSKRGRFMVVRTEALKRSMVAEGG